MKNILRFSTILIVLALAILACSVTSGGDDLPSNVLFQDDFSRTSSGWDRVNIEGEGMTDYQDGVYRIQVLTAETIVWSNPGLDFSDVQIEVDSTKVGGPDDNDFGVICRYEELGNDQYNYYFFLISSDGYYGIGKVLGDSQELIGTDVLVTSEHINQGMAANHIRADCVGSTLTLYVNGQMLTSQRDTNLTSGDVGLLASTYGTAGTDIHFDNFSVLKPEGSQ